MLPKRLLYASVAFLLSMGLILLAKPAMLFDAEGQPRPFGTAGATPQAGGPTVFSLGVVTAILAILCVYVFTWLDTFPLAR